MSKVLQFCCQHPHVCQAGLFVLSLSLQANKVIYNAAKENQADNCQHRWFFEEEQMIKSVRFNSKLTTALLFLPDSLTPCSQTVGKVER